jgi:hypothetical protein
VNVGIKNKQRRAVRAKERQRRARSQGSMPPLTPAEQVIALVMATLDGLCQDGPDEPNPYLARLATTSTSDGPRATLVDQILGDLVEEQLDEVWRHGWQPAIQEPLFPVPSPA